MESPLVPTKRSDMSFFAPTKRSATSYSAAFADVTVAEPADCSCSNILCPLPSELDALLRCSCVSVVGLLLRLDLGLRVGLGLWPRLWLRLEPVSGLRLGLGLWLWLRLDPLGLTPELLSARSRFPWLDCGLRPRLLLLFSLAGPRSRVCLARGLGFAPAAPACPLLPSLF